MDRKSALRLEGAFAAGGGRKGAGRMSGPFCAGGGATFSQCGTDCRGGRRCPPICPVSPDYRCMRRHRSRAFGDPLFLSCQKKWAKRGAGYESDCTASHRISPSKNAAASTRESLCKAILQRRLRGDNTPIGSSCLAGRWQNTLPWKWQAIYVCADGATIFAFYCKCL